MLMRNSKNKAQTILEYAALIAIAVAALMAMKVYFKRSYEGKLRDNADRVGEQFSPKNHTYDWTTTSSSTSHEEELIKGGVKTTAISQNSTRTGDETFKGIDKDSMWDTPQAPGGK